MYTHKFSFPQLDLNHDFHSIAMCLLAECSRDEKHKGFVAASALDGHICK